MAPYSNRSDNIGESGEEIVKEAKVILDNNKISEKRIMEKI